MSDTYTTVETQASYGIGLQMGEQLRSNPFDGLDIAAVQAGLADSFNKQPSKVDNDALREAFNQIHERMQAAKAEQFASVIEEGAKYLEENAKRDEVTVTESGLQYEVITQGDGDVPALTSTVRTHYHGTLLDGSVFDSSVDRGEPISFGLNQVISGWTEGVQLMTVGDKFRFYIPSELAYGNRAAGAIKPGSLLIFDVQLLAIE